VVVAARIAGFLLLLALPTFGQSDEVRLKNGDILRGSIIEVTDDVVVFDHVSLGRLSIPRESVATYLDTSAGKAAEKDDQLTDELKELEKQIPKPEWKGSLNLGGSFTNDEDGEKLKFNMRVRAVRTTDLSRLILGSGWIWEYNNGVPDENAFNVTSNYRWRREKEKRNFWWFDARYDYDEFRSWIQRFTTHGGIGYEVIMTPTVRVAALVGAGARKEWGSEGDPLKVEGAIGADLSWSPRDRQRIDLAFTLFPTTNISNTRSITTLDWSVLLDRRVGMSFNTHLFWEWSTDPDPGFPDHTIRWTWGLQFDF
jgi:hypothetical protein